MEMGVMAKKVPFNKTGIGKLPDDKPVVYHIKTPGGKTNYIGSAQRGRVQERLQDHLGKIPGGNVQIQQFGNINEARRSEQRAIARTQPKHNKQGN